MRVQKSEKRSGEGVWRKMQPIMMFVVDPVHKYRILGNCFLFRWDRNDKSWWLDTTEAQGFFMNRDEAIAFAESKGAIFQMRTELPILN